MGKFEVQALKMNFRFMVLILTKTDRGLGVFPQPSSNMKEGKYEMGNNARQQG